MENRIQLVWMQGWMENLFYQRCHSFRGFFNIHHKIKDNLQESSEKFGGFKENKSVQPFPIYFRMLIFHYIVSTDLQFKQKQDYVTIYIFLCIPPLIHGTQGDKTRVPMRSPYQGIDHISSCASNLYPGVQSQHFHRDRVLAWLHKNISFSLTWHAPDACCCWAIFKPAFLCVFSDYLSTENPRKIYPDCFLLSLCSLLHSFKLLFPCSLVLLSCSVSTPFGSPTILLYILYPTSVILFS